MSRPSNAVIYFYFQLKTIMITILSDDQLNQMNQLLLFVFGQIFCIGFYILRSEKEIKIKHV